MSPVVNLISFAKASVYGVLHHQRVDGSVRDESPVEGLALWAVSRPIQVRAKGIVHAHDGGAPLHGGDDVVDGPHD